MAPKASSGSTASRKSKAKKQSSPKPKASTENYPPRYPQCLREADQVNQYLIPIIDSPTNLVLGPIYFPTAPVELPTYYPVNYDEPFTSFTSGLHRTGWSTKGTIQSWPTVFPSWEKWVNRMKKYLTSSWQKMNLYEVIDLSTQPQELNPNLIAIAACFLSVSSNAFVFPDGPMTPNVLDIIHLTGLSSLDGGSCLSYAEYLLSHEPRQENASFKRYFKTFYSPSIGDSLNWLPFKECSYSVSEKIKPILQLMVPVSMVNSFWASILIPRFISVGFSPLTSHFANCSFEIYFPNQCARQFGLTQGIPVPYTHPRIKDLAKTRPAVTETSLIKELVGHFQGTIASFQFKSL
ncbi:hypothetical protein RHGRI_009957 [Rhododendron griersonianum]|uniref:Coat protein n=1 Tax=Rhododendron griersonianum TaxID=479676 RepID=A0AAV6KHI0_9ERIC|nr:hypothetical protein RHGRI_009957 [Rhododendron griersonianum]